MTIKNQSSMGWAQQQTLHNNSRIDATANDDENDDGTHKYVNDDDTSLNVVALDNAAAADDYIRQQQCD
jgi:hypothetical protein